MLKESKNISFKQFFEFIKKEEFKGWDPYDGLNSPLIQSTSFKKNYYARLYFNQLIKKAPLNIRPLLGIQKEYNPKSLGLFISALCNYHQTNTDLGIYDTVIALSDEVLSLSSSGYSGDCWGYNFDWQARDFFFPKYVPTIVATSFVANALIDVYEITKNDRYLNSAISSSSFVLKDLRRIPKAKGFIFSYSPLDQRQVYNASFLASKLLARLYSYTKEAILLETALESVQACVDEQNPDGSWYYGGLDIQKWIDSFHTGYNLECLYDFQKYTRISDFDLNITKGLNYYIKNFFLEDGTPKYFHNKTYPIDIHCPAQFIVTLSRLNKFTENIALIEKVIIWTIDNMYDKKKGYFYYQKNAFYTNKIPYIRWGQAWMLYALSYYLLNTQST